MKANTTKLPSRDTMAALWAAAVRRARRRNLGFLEAAEAFEQRYGYAPPHDLPGMPKDQSVDWFRLIRDVGPGRLIKARG